MYKNIYTFICIYVHIYIFTYIHVCTHAYIYIYTCIYTHVNIYVYICMYARIYVYLYIYVCVYLYEYMHIYIYITNRHGVEKHVTANRAVFEMHHVFGQSTSLVGKDILHVPCVCVYVYVCVWVCVSVTMSTCMPHVLQFARPHTHTHLAPSSTTSCRLSWDLSLR